VDPSAIVAATGLMAAELSREGTGPPPERSASAAPEPGRCGVSTADGERFAASAGVREEDSMRGFRAVDLRSPAGGSA
jgi:hypothetical protein